MKESTDKSNNKEETRALRIEDSRSSIKTKNNEKGKVIRAQKDRQTVLKTNRDDWKVKCKEREKECIEADNKYKHVAALFEMKEEELRGILKEFEELKKKYPS